MGLHEPWVPKCLYSPWLARSIHWISAKDLQTQGRFLQHCFRLEKQKNVHKNVTIKFFIFVSNFQCWENSATIRSVKDLLKPKVRVTESHFVNIFIKIKATKTRRRALESHKNALQFGITFICEKKFRIIFSGP